MGNLKFNELYFGKIDAYNEFLDYGKDVFKNIFFEYPNFNIEKVLNGSIYYICGEKGTGKTMLLKYIESILHDDEHIYFSEFIRFKKDFDEDSRDELRRAATSMSLNEEIIEKEVSNNSNIDYILAWEVYLIKVIVTRLNKTEYGVFDRLQESWQALSNLLKVVYNEENTSSSIKRMLPKLKRGFINIDVAQVGKLHLDFEWKEDGNGGIPFNVFGKKVISLYSTLMPVGESKIYILIDELELSFRQRKQYNRDISLIRDLIFAIQYLSEISKINGYSVYFIASIRNEVCREVAAKGLELNKPIHDFGVQIDWSQKGGDIKNNPLLRMIQKKIEYSEERAGVQSGDIWEEYFVPNIGREKVSIFNYIIDQTWGRPRDLIRLFTILQQKYGDRRFADQEVFDGIRQQYSKESWEEFEEVLTATYSNREAVGIRHALTGIKTPFTVNDFSDQIQIKKDTFLEVEELIKNNRKPAYILRDLYDLGVVGNSGKYPRFSFKGEADIDPSTPLIVHYPLRRYFKI